jgi:hypothetical protein
MTNQIGNVMKLHWVSTGSKVGWVVLPWGILLSSFLINFLLGFSMGDAIQTGGLASIYIYMSVAGTSILNATFPFSLNFSISRRDYFVGTAIMFGIVCLLNVLTLYILALVESKLTNGWGVRLSFFQVSYFSSGSAMEQITTYFLVMLWLSFFGFMAGGVYQRFGLYGIYGFFGVLSLIFTLIGFFATYFSWWDEIFSWLGSHTAFTLSLWTLPQTAAFGLLTYWMLRRATV